MTANATSPLLLNPRAAIAVTCPKCHTKPGSSCTSTGGGNDAYVPTHQQRINRITGWTETMQDEAAELVLTVRRGTAARASFAAYESAATPIEVKPAKQPTPKGVTLTDKQASYVELAAEHGVLYAPTGHFDGDHQKRQTINALEVKGVVAADGETDAGERLMRLTPFGWQVYRQHRLIIRRLDDAEVDRLEAAANR